MGAESVYGHGEQAESRFPGWTHSLRLSGAPSSVNGKRTPGLWLTSHQTLVCPGQRAALLLNRAREQSSSCYAGCSSQGREGDEQGTPSLLPLSNDSEFLRGRAVGRELRVLKGQQRILFPVGTW